MGLIKVPCQSLLRCGGWMPIFTMAARKMEAQEVDS